MTRAHPRTRRLRRPVTALPSGTPLIVFDDVCVLCSGFVQWVIRNDRRRIFRFASAQGPLGRAIYGDLGLDPKSLETILLVEDDSARAKSDAILAIAARLGGAWRVAAALRLLPAALADWIYDRIARNRYALFGRRPVCWTPPPDAADRML